MNSLYRTTLIIISLLSRTRGILPQQCTNPAGTLTGDIDLQLKDGSGKTIRKTVISSNIGLRETLCFYVKYNYTNEFNRKREREVLYTLDYERLIHVYNYKSMYKFAIPATDATCWCDCPNFSNQCDSKLTSCDKDNKRPDLCVNYFVPGQSSSGCVMKTGSGQTCCVLNIVRLNGDTYNAVEIASPSTRAVFKLNIIDVEDKEDPFYLLKDKYYNLDLDDGTVADDSVLLHVTTSSTASALPAGWYYGKVGTSELKTNVMMNGKDEWDINKLGWFKVDDGVEVIRKPVIKSAFRAETVNCGANNMKTFFAASYYNENPPDAEDATKFFLSKVDYVMRNDSSRQVMAFHRTSPRLNIKVTFNEKSKIQFLFDEATFRDFKGAIILDKFSNRYANITIFDGSGTITGDLKVNKMTQETFHVYVPKNSKVYTKYVRLTATCGVGTGDLQGKDVAEVCLKPMGVKVDYMCQTVICHTEKMTDFEVRDDNLDYKKKEFDDILSLSTWSKYLNPVQWFKGGKPSWVEGVIIVVFILVLAFVIGILVKLARMFNCIFKCLTCCGGFKKKSKHTYDMVRIRAGSMGKYRRQASERVKSVIPTRRSENRRDDVSRPDSLGEDLHYIVVNDNRDLEEENKRVRFENLVSSKTWAF